MLAITHLLVCLVIIEFLSLDRKTAMVVLFFGVFIDLDHLMGVAQYLSQAGVAHAFDINMALNSDIEWKSILHQSVSIVWITPVAVLFAYAAPLLAWSLHLVMDYVQIFYLGIASFPEAILAVGVAALLVSKKLRDYRALSERPFSYREFLTWELESLKRELGNWVPSLNQKPQVEG